MSRCGSGQTASSSGGGARLPALRKPRSTVLLRCACSPTPGPWGSGSASPRNRRLPPQALSPSRAECWPAPGLPAGQGPRSGFPGQHCSFHDRVCCRLWFLTSLMSLNKSTDAVINSSAEDSPWWLGGEASCLPVLGVVGSETVTGRKARGLQTEEMGCKCQTFLSLLSSRRKQVSDIFFFPSLYIFKKRFLLKYCVTIMPPAST